MILLLAPIAARAATFSVIGLPVAASSAVRSVASLLVLQPPDPALNRAAAPASVSAPTLELGAPASSTVPSADVASEAPRPSTVGEEEVSSASWLSVVAEVPEGMPKT